MNSYPIPDSLFKAVVPFAGRNDIRTQLNAVFFTSADGHARIYATDGLSLAVGRFAVPPELPPLEILIPARAARGAKAPVAAKGCEKILLLQDVPGVGWMIGGSIFEALPLQPRPDYKTAFPENWSGEAGYFDPEIVGRLEESRKALRLDCAARPFHNGNARTLWAFPGEEAFAAVLQPLTVPGAPAKNLPAWVRDPL